MTTIYVYCDSEYEITREKDNNDEWDIGDDGNYNHKFTITSEKIKGESHDFSTVTKHSSLYVVAVIYSTGCTFGRTEGCVQYIAVYAKKDLDLLIKAINDGDADKVSKIANKIDKHFWPSFYGYFESVQDVVILKWSSDDRPNNG